MFYLPQAVNNYFKAINRYFGDFLGGPVVKEKKMEVVGLCNWDE